ncbi:DUF5999 family protein [Streptomyces sp. cmx-4-7]|uniref:DUF5999 family protein n=1 Tax=Streptomyces sp. cmx-4-7 TaxID=2790939 RepID=UPI00397EFCC7
MMCQHQPQCPGALRPDGQAARSIVAHPEQGWWLLCNGTLLFEDTGRLLPSGEIVRPQRPGTSLALATKTVLVETAPAKGGRP